MDIRERDFTLNKYARLCVAICESSYRNVTFREYLEGSTGDYYLLVRHDVDENSRFALDMAEVENYYGIKATYYFRIRKRVYVTSIIDKIASFGHEIGYHYETVDEARGNLDLAVRLFTKNLKKFRERYDVKTVCMHGNPLSKWDNKRIWEVCTFADFGLLGEPYLSLDYKRFLYLSDSGRTWDSIRNKVKDKVESSSLQVRVGSTDEVINVVKNGHFKNICILVHPERWPKAHIDYFTRCLIDLSYNIGKSVIRTSLGNS